MLRQVTQGLQHLHVNGIVHRNLNPSSIHISIPCGTGRPRMKLADYCISRVFSIDREPFPLWRVAGDKSWLSPECYEASEFTMAMDTFALGLTFGFALSGGVHPYGNQEVERIYNIKKKKSMILTVHQLKNAESGAARRVFNLIRSMLNIQADQRPSTADVLNNPYFTASSFGNNFKRARGEPSLGSSSKSRGNFILRFLFGVGLKLIVLRHLQDRVNLQRMSSTSLKAKLLLLAPNERSQKPQRSNNCQIPIGMKIRPPFVEISSGFCLSSDPRVINTQHLPNVQLPARTEISAPPTEVNINQPTVNQIQLQHSRVDETASASCSHQHVDSKEPNAVVASSSSSGSSQVDVSPSHSLIDSDCSSTSEGTRSVQREPELLLPARGEKRKSSSQSTNQQKKVHRPVAAAAANGPNEQGKVLFYYEYVSLFRILISLLLTILGELAAKHEYADYVQSRIKENMRVFKVGTSDSGTVLFVRRSDVFHSLFNDHQVKVSVILTILNCVNRFFEISFFLIIFFKVLWERNGEMTWVRFDEIEISPDDGEPIPGPSRSVLAPVRFEREPVVRPVFVAVETVPAQMPPVTAGPSSGLRRIKQTRAPKEKTGDVDISLLTLHSE